MPCEYNIDEWTVINLLLDWKYDEFVKSESRFVKSQKSA